MVNRLACLAGEDPEPLGPRQSPHQERQVPIPGVCKRPSVEQDRNLGAAVKSDEPEIKSLGRGGTASAIIHGPPPGCDAFLP